MTNVEQQETHRELSDVERQETGRDLLQQPFEFGLVPEGETLEQEVDLDYLEPSVEKGWEAYGVGIGAWCALFPCAGLLNTIGTFQSYVGRHQLKDYSDQQIAWIFSMYPFLLALGSAQVAIEMAD
ncbi:MAG: hypothetical protein Q9164_000531 [Protoblastenia rupestris]